MEALKRKEEKEREKAEKERQKAEEKAEKERQKAEKERQKAEEKAEKERLKAEEKAKKEEDRQKKEEERAKKKEEKAEKEAERERKIEEKRQKEEEKIRQEQNEKEKREKEKKSFTNFFIRKAETTKTEKKFDEAPTSLMNSFRVKKDMRLAPVVRREGGKLADEAVAALDRAMKSADDDIKPVLYLAELRKGTRKAGSWAKTWPVPKVEEEEEEVEILEEVDDDVLGGCQKVVVQEQEENHSASHRAKLLQFCENQRPPYWGTWSKRSTSVTARRPFGKDQAFFDYEYDSDDDWEEEEQGESLSDEEKDKEDEEEETEDDNDGFFVGHGVLDKDELMAIDEEDEMESSVSVGGAEVRKNFDEELEEKKQLLRAQQFEEEYKKKRRPTKLKPRVFGCMFVHDEKRKAEIGEIAYEQLLKILSPYKAVVANQDLNGNGIPTTISTPKPSPGGPESSASTPNNANSTSETGSARAKRQFPPEAIPDFVRLIHGNVHNKVFLSKEFAAFWTKKKGSAEPSTSAGTPKPQAQLIAKSKILEKLSEIADYKRSEAAGGRMCWNVKSEVMSSLEISPEAPNKWEYILEQPQKRVSETAKSEESDQNKKEFAAEKEKKRVSIQTLFQNMKKTKEQNNGKDDDEVQIIDPDKNA